jgi:lauroyl/myristoyl acyltransferase
MCIFGQNIPRDRTLGILFKRSRAPGSFGLMQRLKNGYDLAIHPLDIKYEAESVSEAAWRILEQYIYRHPEQWYLWPSFETEYEKYLSIAKSYAN